MNVIMLFIAVSFAGASPLVQPQDLAYSSFSAKGVAVGTTSAPTSPLTVYGVTGSSTTSPTVTCSAGSPTVTPGSTSEFGSYAAGTLATACSVFFTQGFPKTPFCECQANANLLVFNNFTSTGSITCAAATAMTGDTITWICRSPP